MDATWHSGPRGRATRTRASASVALRGRISYIFLLYIGYSTYKPSIEEFANRYNLPHLINPMNLFVFLRVGLCYLRFL